MILKLIVRNSYILGGIPSCRQKIFDPKKERDCVRFLVEQYV